MKKLYRLLSLALAALLMLTAPAFAEIETCPPVEAGIREITVFGNITMDISGDTLFSLGYEYGDIVTVDIAGHSIDMPLCKDYNYVDAGLFVFAILPPESIYAGAAVLAINMGNLTGWLDIAEKRNTDVAPGYVWDYKDAYKDGVSIRLSLKEKGGYLDEMALHQLEMSVVREDYPNLSDEEYANFRNIATTGMGANVLYRSSSPVDPQYGRNFEADAAVNKAGISTIMNLGDTEVSLKNFENYAYTYYSRLNVIPLDMSVEFEGDRFQRPLAEGLRYCISHEGPYMIHCTMGKDRTGFVCALLECLMGASYDEVEMDYMLTYKNFYGVEPGTKTWEAIADGNIRKFLPKAFELETLDGADLVACAEGYLRKIGMTEDEISALKTCLGTDIK